MTDAMKSDLTGTQKIPAPHRPEAASGETVLCEAAFRTFTSWREIGFSYSPMILTNTRFLRRPSNSP